MRGRGADALGASARPRRGAGPPWRGALAARAAVLLGLAAVLAACDGDPVDPVGPTAGNSGTSGPAADPDRVPVRPQEPAVVEPVRGSAEREVPWRLVRGRAADRRLVLEVQLGGPPCDALTGVEVRERASSVAVTVRAGRVPGARCGPGVQAVVGTFRVVAALDSPLGRRRVVDGARP